jgi:type I restriction enzyme M protein
MTNIAKILKDSDYSIEIFTHQEVNNFERTIVEKAGKLYVNCLIKKKEIQLKPEEIVRQLYLSKLLKYYGYPRKLIKLEQPIRFGRDLTKSADIVILIKTDQPLNILLR